MPTSLTTKRSTKQKTWDPGQKPWFPGNSSFNYPLTQYPELLENFSNPLSNWFFENSSGLTIWEDDKCFFVEAVAPGCKTQEIEVTVDKGYVRIYCERTSCETSKNAKFYHTGANCFSYSVALPNYVDTAKEPIATYKNGLLYLAFKKTKTGQSKRVNIKVK